MVERKSGGSNFLHKYDVSYTLGGNCDKLSCKRTKTGKSRAVSSVWHGKFKRRPEYFGLDGTAVFDNLIIRIFVYRAALGFRRKNSMDFDRGSFTFFSIFDVCRIDWKSCNGFEKQRGDT